MAKLILLRHLQSQWNKENRFSGWQDIPLSEEGRAAAPLIAQKLASEEIDQVYTSPLRRNHQTARLILGYLGRASTPTKVEAVFNERSYGLLEGLNKEEVKTRFGEEQVNLWRRSWDVAPPEGESLKDVSERVLPFFHNSVETDLLAGKNVLIVASHNSLRAIAKYIEKISDEAIRLFEFPSGGIAVYDFDENLNLQNKELR